MRVIIADHDTEERATGATGAMGATGAGAMGATGAGATGATGATLDAAMTRERNGAVPVPGTLPFKAAQTFA